MSDNIPTLFNVDDNNKVEVPTKKGLQPFWQTDDGNTVRLFNGDCLHVLRQMPSRSVQLVCCSPPYYGLRDYGTASWKGGDPKCEHKDNPLVSSSGTSMLGSRDGKGGNKRPNATMPILGGVCKCGAKRIDQQIGSEATPQEFIRVMVEVFREIRRVLRNDGVVWINLGSSYVSTPVESDEMVLRENLTDVERKYVLEELAKCL